MSAPGDERLQAALAQAPALVSAHVLLSAAALALALAIGLPLAVVAARRPRLGVALNAVVGVVQTTPSLALLALFYPLLLMLSTLSRDVFGFGFSALGFAPSLAALTLYALLPILRNGAAGLRSTPAGLVDAALSLGLGRTRTLFLVEAPAAAAVIMAGVRTAAVWTIGTATLSTPVGQPSLGDLIFTGLQTENWVAVVVGALAAATLALVTDAVLAQVEAAARRGKGRRMAAGLLALGLGVAAAAAQGWTPSHAPAAYVVGSKNFSEQFILASLIQDRIEDEEGRVERRDGLGSAVAFRALAADEIDVYVDYAGTLWTTVLGRTDQPPRDELNRILARELKARYRVETLGSLGFENAYALAMTRQRARSLGLATIADLARVSPRLSMGGDLEIFSRPEWAAIVRAYGLSFAKTRRYQPTFMYRALESGDVDVISAFSSDGRLAADDLVILSDPKGAIPPYDAIILLAPRRAGDERLKRALRPLVGAIDADLMRRANLAVDGQGRAPAAAARDLDAKLKSKAAAP